MINVDFTKVTNYVRISQRDTDTYNKKVNELLNEGYVILQAPFVTDESSNVHRLNVCDMGKIKEVSNETTIKE